jgi:hypothetical protein
VDHHQSYARDIRHKLSKTNEWRAGRHDELIIWMRTQ